MKFYLAKHEKLDMKYGYSLQNDKGETVRRTVIPVKITPSGDSKEEREFCENVNEKIAAGECGKLQSTGKQLIISMAANEGTLAGCLGIADGYGDILGALHKIFGDGNIRMEVVVENFRDLAHATPAKRFNIFTKELNVFYRSNLKAYASEDADFQFNDAVLFDKFKMDLYPLGGSITIVVNVDESSMKCDKCQHKFQIYKKMLEEEICCDAVIFAKDGISVRCHKGILSAQSPVLRAIFETNMKEGNEGILEMPDMSSEQSVRAFLAYLYYWEETSGVEQSSQVAFDLFYAAHKYDIPSLEKSIKKMLLAKHNGWYDVEVALKLFLFARNLPSPYDGQYELTIKAVKVLKLNYNVLEKSLNYKKLFKDEPEAAMELCKLAFSIV